MSHFPPTHWSLISAAGNDEGAVASAALEELCRIYRPAVLAFARQALSNDQDAEDITQEFFASLLQRRRIMQARSDLGKFRTFLLADFKQVWSDHLKRQRAKKRGGGQDMVAIDDLAGDVEPATPFPDPSQFDVEWAMAVVREAVRLLAEEESTKPSGIPFAELKRFLPGFGSARPPSYEELERQYGVSVGALRVRVNRLRKRFKELINAVLADTVSSAADLESERQALHGGLLRSLG